MVGIDSRGSSVNSEFNLSLVPSGFAWSDNSCAYDSVLTILFSIWTSDNQQSEELFSGINSVLAKNLHKTFQNIKVANRFEKHRDIFRRSLENIDPRSHIW